MIRCYNDNIYTPKVRTFIFATIILAIHTKDYLCNIHLIVLLYNIYTFISILNNKTYFGIFVKNTTELNWRDHWKLLVCLLFLYSCIVELLLCYQE